VLLIASDLAAIIIIMVVSTVFVVVVVLGLHVWGAIQDGREEKEMSAEASAAKTNLRGGQPETALGVCATL
jgi:hypothetical protein